MYVVQCNEVDIEEKNRKEERERERKRREKGEVAERRQTSQKCHAMKERG